MSQRQLLKDKLFLIPVFIRKQQIQGIEPAFDNFVHWPKERQPFFVEGVVGVEDNLRMMILILISSSHHIISLIVNMDPTKPILGIFLLK